MAGVYIKGVEMPTNDEMLVIITPNGEVRYKKSVESMLDSTTSVPVPPHGGLIDLETIVDSVCNGVCSCSECSFNQNPFDSCVLQTNLEKLKVVIPADKVEVARPVGEWEYYKQGLVRCSECHDCYIDEMYITREKWKFCPTCGARLEYVDNSKA